MTQELEVLDTQEEELEVETPNVETLSAEEIADLKKRADVSSQNYERAKKAEQRLKELEEAQLGTDSFVSDDDTARQLRELNDKFNRIEERAQLDSLYKQYPAIQDKLSEFDEFRREYVGIGLDKVAKIFLVEKDLLEESPKRKGLEKASGGRRTPPPSASTNDDVKRLRENNYREYVKQIRSGKIV